MPSIGQSMYPEHNSLESEIHGVCVSEQRFGTPGNHVRGLEWTLRPGPAGRTTSLRVRGWIHAQTPAGSRGKLFEENLEEYHRLLYRKLMALGFVSIVFPWC